MIVVQLVLARITLGMTEASATLMFSKPWMFKCWSTTDIGSDEGPILQVPEAWVVLNTVLSNHWSKASSLARASSLGSMTLSTIGPKDSFSSSSMVMRTDSRSRSRSRSNSR